MDFKHKGIDTAARLTAIQAASAAEQGVEFVGRYLVEPSMSKALTLGEIKILHGANLGILLIWETTANRAKYGESAGSEDGTRARNLAASYAVQTGTVIYFAVDYDAPKRDYQSIDAYLCAAKAACAPYKCGVYGKADLINSVKADAYMQCVAWSYGVQSHKANVYQYEWQGGANAKSLAAKIGVAVDLDGTDDMTAAGIWMPPKPKQWYDDAMAWADRQGLIRDGRPDDPVTRAELATVLYRIFGPEDDKENSGLLS